MQRLEKILAQKAPSKSARMAKLWQFSQVHPKPAFSEKVHWGDQEKIFKNRPKSSPRFKRPTPLWRKCHYKLFPLLMQRLKKILGQKSGSKSSRMTKSWQFWQGHPKPAFSEKVQRGDQGKFFKNRPKGCPRLKGPKALWRKWHYPLNKIALKVQRLETILV